MLIDSVVSLTIPNTFVIASVIPTLSAILLTNPFAFGIASDIPIVSLIALKLSLMLLVEDKSVIPIVSATTFTTGTVVWNTFG